MKRVGIVTFFQNCNYGSVLQAYALKQYLGQKGYDAEIIDYLNPDNRFNLVMKGRTICNRLAVWLVHPGIWKTYLQSRSKAGGAVKLLPGDIVQQFRDFVEARLHPFRGKYHRSGDFDAFICGSDQIWQISAPGLNDVFFLRFASSAKRIAYAVSLGSVSVPKYNARRLKKYLRGFSAISVREHTSQKLIKAFCGCESVHVLDPVLLVGREFWGQLACDPPQKDKYLFCYFLDNCTDAQNIIRLARANNLQVLWVQMGTDIPDGAEGVCPSPAEFVSLMQNAEYVFTDSFHACCFSALFEKSFYVIRRNYQGYPAQHIRIQELLSTLQMNERHLDSCAQLERLQPIAEERFRLAQSRFTERRTVSERFLEDALQNI